MINELYSLRSTPSFHELKSHAHSLDHIPAFQTCVLEVLDRINRDLVAGPNGCWIWIGAGDRYGKITFRSRSIFVHRLMHELYNGPIPDGKIVMHKCDISLCVNPFHLTTGTYGDNTTDMIAKGRRIQPTYAGPYTRWLTRDNILSIREQLSKGVPGTTIANRFGVSSTTIYRIRDGKMWSNIQ